MHIDLLLVIRLRNSVFRIHSVPRIYDPDQDAGSPVHNIYKSYGGAGI